MGDVSSAQMPGLGCVCASVQGGTDRGDREVRRMDLLTFEQR